MNGQLQLPANLSWRELLSPDEIVEWARSRKKSCKLRRVGGVSQPGVYRFIFPGNKCYIGVAGDLSRRLYAHVVPEISQQSESDAKNDRGRRVRDAIKNLLGKCYLQKLIIEGPLDICGVKVNPHDLVHFPVRLLLENWAILYSEQVEKLVPLNRSIPTGIQQDLKDDLRPAGGNLLKVGRHGKIIRRGGLKSLL